jgi:hypothetical protein
LKRREWLLETIICLSRWQSTFRGNGQYKRGNIVFRRKIDPF